MSFPSVGCRWVIAGMVFAIMFVNYLLRVNLSVNLVAMVPIGDNVAIHTDNILDWTAIQRGHVLSGYSWGYVVSNIIGGSLAERWGAKLVLMVTNVMSALLTLLSPPSAKHSFIMMLMVRILIGFCGGFQVPAVHCLIANWAVPSEKGKFVGGLVFGTIGTVIAWSLCGILINAFGWEWGFNFFAIISAIFTFMIWFFVFDSPEEHPRITDHEQKFIADGMISSNKRKVTPPYLKILTSIPVWSVTIGTFGTGWGVFFIITAAPNFISNVLGYKIGSTGLLSSMIYLARSSSAFLFGIIGDYITQKKLISVRVLRNCGCFLAYIIPGCLLFLMTIDDISPEACIAVMVTSMAMNGAVSVSTTVNPHDLSKNFAGTVVGIATCAGTIAGIITPLVTAAFTQHDETNIESWRPVFYTGATVYILTGLQFLIFSSTEVQHWNEIEETKLTTEKEKTESY